MKLVLQRVQSATVEVNSKIVGAIRNGLLVLIGIEHSDTLLDAEWLVQKTINMRIFSDEEGKMNRSLLDIEGEMLVISQFTLHASSKKGNRPSFIEAARPEVAIPLYESFVQMAQKELKSEVKTGVFGADMQVALINDGPVTLVIDSKNKV